MELADGLGELHYQQMCNCHEVKLTTALHFLHFEWGDGFPRIARASTLHPVCNHRLNGAINSRQGGRIGYIDFHLRDVFVMKQDNLEG